MSNVLKKSRSSHGFLETRLDYVIFISVLCNDGAVVTMIFIAILKSPYTTTKKPNSDHIQIQLSSQK